jgi:hypothetical protein
VTAILLAVRLTCALSTSRTNGSWLEQFAGQLPRACESHGTLLTASSGVPIASAPSARVSDWSSDLEIGREGRVWSGGSTCVHRSLGEASLPSRQLPQSLRRAARPLLARDVSEQRKTQPAPPRWEIIIGPVVLDPEPQPPGLAPWIVAL